MEAPERPAFSIRSRGRSFTFAWRGLRRFAATQHNAWIHTAATLAVIAAAAALRISREDWRWIVLAIAMVWVAEALNTAVEQLGDAISLAPNERIGFAKDVAAGAVLAAAVAAALIGLLTLGPYLLAML